MCVIAQTGFQIRGNFVSGEEGVPLMAPYSERDWTRIAEQASKETDPQKLMILIGKLCGALEIERRTEVLDGSEPRGNEPGPFPGN
jgi:hypothetical protein